VADALSTKAMADGAVLFVLLVGVEAGSAELILSPASSSSDEKRGVSSIGSFQARVTTELG
jgi:hypothetical protein